MPIIRWKPLSEIERFFDEELRRWNGDLAVDIYEDNGNLIVEMSVAGIDPDKIDISVEDTHLRVCGEREEKRETGDKNFYRKEIKRGEFERVVQLPCDVDIKRTTAQTKNGLIRICLPKKEPAKAEKIKI